MGSDLCYRMIFSGYEFQSTLPHGERPPLDGLNHPVGDISIHAPAWGATGYDYAETDDLLISIHAPAWGATSLP